MTHPEIEIVMKLYPLFLGVIVLVAWLIRLEAKQLYTSKDFNDFKDDTKKVFDDHKKDVKETNSDVHEEFVSIRKQNNEILQSLSRLEGRLNIRKGVNNEKDF
jgi:hypothetical protein